MFLQNNFLPAATLPSAVRAAGFCPSSEAFTDDDRAIYLREGIRWENSLAAAKNAGFNKFVAALHYPPLYKADEETIFTELFAKYGVAHCVFGHIHGQDAGNIFEGETRGVAYSL